MNKDCVINPKTGYAVKTSGKIGQSILQKVAGRTIVGAIKRKLTKTKRVKNEIVPKIIQTKTVSSKDIDAANAIKARIKRLSNPEMIIPKTAPALTSPLTLGKKFKKLLKNEIVPKVQIDAANAIKARIKRLSAPIMEIPKTAPALTSPLTLGKKFKKLLKNEIVPKVKKQERQKVAEAYVLPTTPQIDREIKANIQKMKEPTLKKTGAKMLDLKVDTFSKRVESLVQKYNIKGINDIAKIFDLTGQEDRKGFKILADKYAKELENEREKLQKFLSVMKTYEIELIRKREPLLTDILSFQYEKNIDDEINKILATK